MSYSQLSLIIALLPTPNMQKMRQNEPFLHYFPTQHGKSGQRHGNVHPEALHSLSFVVVLSKPFLVLSKPSPRIVQALASYCLTPHVVFFICLCCDKNTLLQTKISYVFPFLKSFRYICNIVSLLQRWYGMTLSKRCY